MWQGSRKRLQLVPFYLLRGVSNSIQLKVTSVQIFKCVSVADWLTDWQVTCHSDLFSVFFFCRVLLQSGLKKRVIELLFSLLIDNKEREFKKWYWRQEENPSVTLSFLSLIIPSVSVPRDQEENNNLKGSESAEWTRETTNNQVLNLSLDDGDYSSLNQLLMSNYPQHSTPLLHPSTTWRSARIFPFSFHGINPFISVLHFFSFFPFTTPDCPPSWSLWKGNKIPFSVPFHSTDRVLTCIA